MKYCFGKYSPSQPRVPAGNPRGWAMDRFSDIPKSGRNYTQPPSCAAAYELNTKRVMMLRLLNVLALIGICFLCGHTFAATQEQLIVLHDTTATETRLLDQYFAQNYSRHFTSAERTDYAARGLKPSYRVAEIAVAAPIDKIYLMALEFSPFCGTLGCPFIVLRQQADGRLQKLGETSTGEPMLLLPRQDDALPDLLIGTHRLHWQGQGYAEQTEPTATRAHFAFVACTLRARQDTKAGKTLCFGHPTQRQQAFFAALYRRDAVTPTGQSRRGQEREITAVVSADMNEDGVMEYLVYTKHGANGACPGCVRIWQNQSGAWHDIGGAVTNASIMDGLQLLPHQTGGYHDLQAAEWLAQWDGASYRIQPLP